MNGPTSCALDYVAKSVSPKELGLPREQQSERSALTLLSLLDLRPGKKWSRAEAPLMGITPMMDFFAAHYGKKYAANTL